ncbi:MAG TPA: hypothetical protein VK894_09425 [Jiangellales bacterium]|nr:hypothetical protein [Jiangellales bacterium]
MTGTARLARCSAAVPVAALTLGLAAAPATARPDPGTAETVQVAARAYSPGDSGCTVTAHGSHLARCDYLTGGVAVR